ncbi:MULTISPECIES: FadR/GntR family transcriptional regulator [Bacillus]|uniref:FadR/GntR family transcriptional regulator n=1 Tax=Bacillus TaxID=1386 RepID=UPI00025323BD|nr:MULTISPECIES: FadR/GntR family transcriptional regulator [Bacillus]AJE80090.1 transcriptional regulator [Bacillus sp. BH072]AMQ75588.1 GntR family transcriptional regulator [Bacillus amyloliquefaciens UMAF6614]CCG51344.1 Fatty acid metabolism regulator protein [Bacillus velezensis YAU B9601-Y2]KFI15050.1 transcriptional regulator [Bacillus velezensis]KOC81510.1 transcriptional regulator [Bacillus velezensis]
MKYKQIKTKKIYEEVADALLEKIKAGELKPGEKLDSVQALSESFQVSRSAVREALSALKAMGLVDMKQGEGTYIREFEPSHVSQPLSSALLMKKEDVKQLLEVRKLLELGVAAMAAEKRTEDDLQKIRQALLEMKGIDGDEELGEKADFSFHMALAEASQNGLLKHLMNHVSALLLETMRETRKIWLFSKRTSVQRLYEEHERIYSAVAAKDADEAEAAMTAHLTNVEEVLGAYFEENV